MNKKYVKILSLALMFVLVATLLTSCDFSLTKDNTPAPVAVTLKSDLNDAVFSFTYGELQGVLPADKLASLFEDYDEKNDDSVIELSYNDIVSRYGEDGDIFDGMMGLLSADEKAQLTANAYEVLEYFVSGINKAKAEKPIVKYEEKFWVDNDTIEFTQNGEKSDSKVTTATKYFSDFVTKGIGNNDDLLIKGTTEKGADLTDILYLFGSDTANALTSEDVVSVISSLSYEEETVTDADKNESSVTTGITRTIVIVVKNDKQSMDKAFSFRDSAPILEEMKKGSSYFTMENYETSFNASRITVTFNAATDEILTANYDKNMIINTAVTGVGSLEYLGKQDLKFECTDNMYYQFGWDSEVK